MYISSIADTLFTKTQQRVLALFFGKPDRSYYTNEIFRLTAMGRGTVQKELERLISADLVTVTKIGNQKHYQVNPGSPIYTELLTIVRKTFGVADVIREALTPISDKISVAFIYGSVAKNTDTKTSDLDLMLIGEELNYGDVMSLLVATEEEIQRVINPNILTTEEFSKRLKSGRTFINRIIEQPKIMVQGSIDEFGKFRKD